MKSFKKITALVLSLSIVLISTPIMSVKADSYTDRYKMWQRLESVLTMYVDSPNILKDATIKQIDPGNFGVRPQKRNNTIMVPAAFIAQSMGAETSWDVETNVLTILSGTTKSTFREGDSIALIGQSQITLEETPEILEGVLLVPLNILANLLGKAVFYANGLIVISGSESILNTNADAGIISEASNLLARECPVILPDVNFDSVETLKSQVEDFMEMPLETLESVVPLQGPMQTVFHPVSGEIITPTFDPKKPQQAFYAATGEYFPNDSYPMTKTETVHTIMGMTVEYPYYQDAAGKKYFFNSLVYTAQRSWLLARIQTVASLYFYTGERIYSERILTVLNRWAELLPNYALQTIDSTKRYGTAYPYYTVSMGGLWIVDDERDPAVPSDLDLFTLMNPDTAEVDRVTEDGSISTESKVIPYSVPWYGVRFSRRMWQEMSLELLYAYDTIQYCGIFDEWSAEKGEDIKKKLETSLFRNLADFPNITGWMRTMSGNLVSHIIAWAYTGRIIKDPSYVHLAYRYVKEVFENFPFSREGLEAESPSYMFTFFSGFGEPYKAMIGYSDPPGYVDPRSGAHLENVTIANNFQREYDFIQKGRAALRGMTYPDGSVPHLHDSNATKLLTDPLCQTMGYYTVMDGSKSYKNDGWGHVVLGAGVADEQVQAHLHYADDKQGHGHLDGLSILLNAFGRQMLDDIGYNQTRYRQFQNYTLSHNTVIIDRQNQNAQNSTHGNMLLYLPNWDGFSVAQVDGSPAYNQKPEKYRRTLMLNSIDTKHPYVVDIFEVKGGSKHDYVLHGTRIHDQDVTVTIPMTAMAAERPLLEEGEVWVEPMLQSNPIPGQGYGAFTGVSEGALGGSATVDFKYIDPYKEDAYHYQYEKKSGNLLTGKSFTSSEMFPTRPLELAFDASPTTYASVRGLPGWFEADLGEIQPVNQIAFRANNTLTGYALKASDDGRKWTTVISNATNGPIAPTGTNVSVSFPEVRARYLSFEITKTDTGKGPALYDFGAYHTSGKQKVDASKEVGLKVHLILTPEKDEDGAKLFVGNAPSMKQGDIYDNDIVDKLLSKFMFERRQSKAGEELESVFVSVLEPYEGETGIEKITPLTATKEQVVLKIEMRDGRVDTVAINLSGQGGVIKTEGLETDALVAFTSTAGHRYMAGGSYFEMGGKRIAEGLMPSYSGEITDIKSFWDGDGENAFVTSADLSGVKPGQYIRVINTDCIGEIKTLQNLAYSQAEASGVYRIEKVEKRGGETYVVVSEETGLRMENGETHAIFTPRRVFLGKNTFEIINDSLD